MYRFIALAMLILILAAWSHGGGSSQSGANVIDDLSNSVIDDLSNQVVAS